MNGNVNTVATGTLDQQHDAGIVVNSDGLEHSLSEAQLDSLQWAKDFLKRFDGKYKKFKH
jgi:hypothetical protein